MELILSTLKLVKAHLYYSMFAFENNILPTEITINPQIDNNYPFKRITNKLILLYKVKSVNFFPDILQIKSYSQCIAFV